MSCAKIAPRYYGPSEILDRIGPVAYRIGLPNDMRIHNLFDVSLLEKYVYDPNHKIDWIVIEVEPEEEFQMEPICILNRNTTTLKNWTMKQVKV